MPDPIKIVVTAETAEAAAAMKKFAAEQGASFKEMATAAHGATGALFQNRMALMELGHVGRATAESLAFGMNPLKVLALESPRILQATSMMGIGLSTLVPWVLGVGAAVGAGYLLWENYGKGMETAEEKAQKLSATLEKVPDLLKQISAAQGAGQISAADAKRFRGYLTKEIPLYRTGGPGSELTEQQFDFKQRPAYQKRDPAPDDEIIAHTQRQQMLAGYEKTRADAANQLKEIHDKDTVEQLAGIEREIAAENERFKKESDHLRDLHDQAVAFGGKDNSGAAAAADARHQAELKRIADKAQAESDRRDLDLQKAYEGALQAELDLEKSITEEERKQQEEAKSLLLLKQEISRAEMQAKLHAIEGNPFLTDQQKAVQSVPIIQSQLTDNVSSIAAKKDLQSQTTDLKARLDLQKQIDEQLVQQVDLQNKLNAAQGQDSFSYQLGAMVVQLQNVGTEAQQAAQVFGSVWNTAMSAITSNFTSLIMGTESWGRALRSIGSAVLNDLVQGMVHMAAQFILQNTIMAAVHKLFHVQAVATQAASTSAQVGIHATGEAAKTGATAAGASTRGGISVMETVWHGIQTAVRTAIHFAGQLAMTSATLAGSLIRHAMVFLELQPYIILAGIEAASAVAGIPIVGPILAPIAAATTIAALETIAAFADGGRPVPGEVALIGERGPELWVPDSAGTIIPNHHLANMQRNGTSSGAVGSSDAGGGGITKVVNVFDRQWLRDELQKPDYAHVIVNHVISNKTKIGIQT